MSNIASQWRLEPGVTYLNHGSFGPSPVPVLEARQEWLARLEREPMDFFVRRLAGYFDEAADALGRFLGCPGENLVFVPNATAGMNIVASNIPLGPDDEVLLTDHEYGAVVRIWGQACREAGAKTVVAPLPFPLNSREAVVEAVMERITPRTKVLVISHVTSQTAVELPVREVCEQARKRGVITVIDGPHAVAMTDFRLSEIPCDFYTASCHKWLSAPFGSGFLYVRSRFKQGLRPTMWSWGRSLMGAAPSWKDEFHWPGTFDPTPYLAIPAAIRFLQDYGLKKFREETHALARVARSMLLNVAGGAPLSEDSSDWYGSMVSVPFPIEDDNGAFPGDMHPLQSWLWEQHRIEMPVIRWRDRTLARVSCHLYTTPRDLEKLHSALREWQNGNQPQE